MKALNHRFTLDMTELYSQATVHIKRNDTKNKLVISLSEHGSPYMLTENAYAVFVGKKPDGKIVINDCEVVGNTIEYTITAQTSVVVGVVDCEVRLYDVNSNLLTSPRFTVIVDEIIFNPDDIQIESENEINVLDSLIDEATKLIADVEGKLSNGEFKGDPFTYEDFTDEQLADLKGEKGADGASGVHIGTDTPPDTANVWINPEGDPTGTEEWEFDLDDGTTDTKQVVVINPEDATANGKLAILRMKDANGNWVEIPALIGSKGDKGDTGNTGSDGYTPVKGIDYFDGKDGYTPVKGIDYFDGKDGTSVTVSNVSESSADDGYNVVTFSDGERITIKNGSRGDKGDKGDTGERGATGESGVVTPVSGFYTLSVDADGNLYVYSANGDIPDFQYDSESGNLYVMQGDIKTLIGNVKGEKGDTGATGADGTSVTVANVSESTADGGSNVVTFSDGERITIKNGSRGSKGDTGDTGSNGISCTHSWNGTTLTVTSASGTTSADLKGDKGDTGEVDYSRLNGYLPLSGGTLTGPIVISGGDAISGAGNIQLDVDGQITAKGTTSTLFGRVSDGDLYLGHATHTLTIRGNTPRPIYNGSYMALQSDFPSNKETWTFTLEDGSTVTKEIYVK